MMRGSGYPVPRVARRVTDLGGPLARLGRLRKTHPGQLVRGFVARHTADGKPRRLPAGEASDDVGGVAASELAKGRGREARGEAVGAEEDELPLEAADVRVRVARVRVDAPLEHRAWDVERAGDDALASALVLRAKIDEERSVARRRECLAGSRRGAMRRCASARSSAAVRRCLPAANRPAGDRDPDAAAGGQGGDDRDRRAGAERVGDSPGEERADDEAEVAPEAVDADELRALDRLDDVGDGGDQGRIDERRADAEQDRRSERRAEGAAAGDEQGERAAWTSMPSDDQRLSAGVVGEPAGQRAGRRPRRPGRRRRRCRPR